MRRQFIFTLGACVVALGCAIVAMGGQVVQGLKMQPHGPDRKDKVVMPESEWRKKLSPKAFYILRQEGTEQAFTSPLLNVHVPGTFYCAGCGLELYRTSDKFDSGTGWPSFVKPIKPDAVWYRYDTSYGSRRTEVRCARCDGHLGHVFDDGPTNRGGLRYCMDGDALTFKPDEPAEK